LLKSLQLSLRRKRNNGATTNKEGNDMIYDEDALMESFDKWDNRAKRERFLKRMEHKLNAKESRQH
jgi:hypothetical protein